MHAQDLRIHNITYSVRHGGFLRWSDCDPPHCTRLDLLDGRLMNMMMSSIMPLTAVSARGRHTSRCGQGRRAWHCGTMQRLSRADKAAKSNNAINIVRMHALCVLMPALPSWPLPLLPCICCNNISDVYLNMLRTAVASSVPSVQFSPTHINILFIYRSPLSDVN